jgi:hypothetical protein
LKVNCYTFKIKWNKTHNGGSFSYGDCVIEIGIKGSVENEIFMVLCHELMEITAIEMNVRLQRPDCNSDFLFVYDHRQHETMMNMFSGLVSQFIE